MQQSKKKTGNEDFKKKERRIVTWSQEEEDILREQISIHGTENWGIIASKFKDKTTRQCRRRWYTYLNSDFKKGGWSPEEDMLLCEAQRIFGNRWTEIAKVVSGRTDNAVKNRFSTLCKKRAKYEAIAKENCTSYINANNKRVILQNEFNTDKSSEGTGGSTKKIRRTHIPEVTKNSNFDDRVHKQCRTIMNQQPRAPFAVLVQNTQNVNSMTAQQHADEVAPDAQKNNYNGSFLKKDDPKISALMQQAEFLSSLALKVNTENSDQSLENAWKILQDFLNQTKESDILKYKFSEFDIQLEDFKDLLDDLRTTDEGCRSFWRQPDLYDESPGSSEYSTGSSIPYHSAEDKIEQIQGKIRAPHQDIELGTQSIHDGEPNGVHERDQEMLSDVIEKQEIFPSSDEVTKNEQVVCALSNTEFNSPMQVTPMFRSLAAGIPSPQFSESERNFLIKTLGMESPSSYPNTNILPTPSCKRALLHSL